MNHAPPFIPQKRDKKQGKKADNPISFLNNSSSCSVQSIRRINPQNKDSSEVEKKKKQPKGCHGRPDELTVHKSKSSMLRTGPKQPQAKKANGRRKQGSQTCAGTLQDTRNYLGLNLTTYYARLEIRKSLTLSNSSDQAKTLGIQHPAKQYQEQVGAKNQDLETVFSGNTIKELKQTFHCQESLQKMTEK